MIVELSHFGVAHNMMRSIAWWHVVIDRCMWLINDEFVGSATRRAVVTFVRMTFESNVQSRRRSVSQLKYEAWTAAYQHCLNLPHLESSEGDDDDGFLGALCKGVGALILKFVDEACECFKTAFELRPDDCEVWCDFMRLWANHVEQQLPALTDDTKAESARLIEIGERFLSALDGNDGGVRVGVVRFRLGQLFRALGNNESARVSLEIAARLCPNDTWTCWWHAFVLLHIDAAANHAAAADVLRAARARGVVFDESKTDEYGCSPIVAAVYKDFALIELLLDVADVKRDGKWQSALVTAAALGDCAVISMLCKRKPSEYSIYTRVEDQATQMHHTAMEAALGNGHFDALEALCEHSVGLKYTPELLSTAIRGLHDGVPDTDEAQSPWRERAREPTCKPACKALRKKVIEFLIGKGCALVDRTGRCDRWPLAMAARAGCIQTVRLLWNLSGHDRNIIIDDHLELTGNGEECVFNSPLSRAAMSGKVAVLEQLVEWHSSDSHAVALTIKFAMDLCRMKVARWLQKHGFIWANIHWFTERPIYDAAYECIREFVHMFANAGAHPDNDWVPAQDDYNFELPRDDWPTMRRLARWRKPEGLLLVLAAAPGKFAKRAWLPPLTSHARLCSNVSENRRIAALFIAAGAPQTDDVKTLIASNAEVQAAIELATTDLERERALAHRSWFAYAGYTRVTDVALALSGTPLPTLVIGEILAREEPRFLLVPYSWISERIDRVFRIRRTRVASSSSGEPTKRQRRIEAEDEEGHVEEATEKKTTQE